MPRAVNKNESVYSIVSVEQIYEIYFPQFEIGKKYCSPFRNDPCPSFQIKYSSSGNLYWVDYGYPYQERYDPAGLIALCEDITVEEAFDKIRRDIIDNDDIEIKPRVRRKKPVKGRFQFFTKEMEDYELAYWQRLHIYPRLLKFLNIKAVRKLSRNGKAFWKSSPENPVFIYLYEEEPCAFKAYRPLDPNKDKFRGQCNGGLIEGWDQLPSFGDTLLITSSYKDTAVSWRLGIPACNPTSENSLRVLLEKYRELNLRFKKIYIIFDSDRPGIQSARKLQQLSFGKWTPIFMRNFKDPSDSVWETGSYFEYINLLASNSIM